MGHAGRNQQRETVYILVVNITDIWNVNSAGNDTDFQLTNPTDTWRNNNIIITSNSRRRFGVIMTLFLRCVSAGKLHVLRI